MRKESIKIVPEKHRRSIPDIIENETNNDKLIELCCPRKECICNDNCNVPKCGMNEVAIIVNNTAECCPHYECQPKRNCTELEDGSVWREPCSRCRCLGKEMFCEQMCKKDDLVTTCTVDQIVYVNGQKWQPDACTTCECENGHQHCTVSSCLPNSCPIQIIMENECCPICDYSDTHFCPGYENCDIVCQYNFTKSSQGCSLCKCAIPNRSIGNPLTTQSSIEVTQPVDFNYIYIIITCILCVCVIAIVAFCCYRKRKNSKSYQTVPTTVDRNWNNIKV